MKKYIITGIITQLCVFIERAIRFPDLLTGEEWRQWKFWLGLIALGTVNVILWPLTIVCEIINIIILKL